MTKTAQSLIAQLRDVARAFYLEVQGEALNAAGVSADSELRAIDKVYYPLALRIAPSRTQPQVDLSSVFALAQSTTTSAGTPAAEKEQDQPTPILVVEMESKEVAEVGKLKRKKKEKEKEASVLLSHRVQVKSYKLILYSGQVQLMPLPFSECNQTSELNEYIQLLFCLLSFV